MRELLRLARERPRLSHAVKRAAARGTEAVPSRRGESLTKKRRAQVVSVCASVSWKTLPMSSFERGCVAPRLRIASTTIVTPAMTFTCGTRRTNRVEGRIAPNSLFCRASAKGRQLRVWPRQAAFLELLAAGGALSMGDPNGAVEPPRGGGRPQMPFSENAKT